MREAPTTRWFSPEFLVLNSREWRPNSSESVPNQGLVWIALAWYHRPMQAPDPILCVGYQAGLLKALRSTARGAFVLLPKDQAPPDAEEVLGWAEVDLHGPAQELESAALKLLGGARPAAVMAMAERTVLCAARLRESFGLPGNHSEVALCCADKVEMKRAMDKAGVPVAAWREVDKTTTAAALVEQLGLPLVLKPRRDSGGRGQSKHTDEADVAHGLQALRDSGGFEEGYGWLAEAWIEGVESSLESFVQAGEPVFMNPTEYYVPRHANILPAALDGPTFAHRREFMTRALKAAGVERGITHMEVFETAKGLVFGELAIRAPGGRLMPLIRRAWGFDPWEASLRLELGEEVRFPVEPCKIAGVWILHPGVGSTQSIDGLEAALELPGVRSIRLKVGVGESIAKRLGTGQDIGSIHVEGASRDAVAESLSAARETLKIELC